MRFINLSEIAKVATGQAAPRDADFGISGYPFIRAGHLENLLKGESESILPKVDHETAKRLKLKLMPADTILFAKSGMSAMKNRVFQTTTPAYIVSHLAAILPSGRFSPLFLKYFFQWFGPSRLIVDESYPSIRLSEIEGIEIPLPPLETQKKIATILDKADELRRNDKKILEKYDQLAQSVFLEMFGDPYLNSKGWIIIELGELCEIIMGQSPKGESYNVTGQGTPLLNGPTEFGENNPTEKQWTTEPRKLCKPDDILFCVRGATAGRMNFADKKYCIGRGLAAIRSKSSVTNKYIFLLLKAMYNIFQKTSDGSTFINISKDDLYAVKVPKTPVEMQNRFASIIDSIEQQKQLTQQSLQKSEELFQSLLQGAFKGEKYIYTDKR